MASQSFWLYYYVQEYFNARTMENNSYHNMFKLTTRVILQRLPRLVSKRITTLIGSAEKTKKYYILRCYEVKKNSRNKYMKNMIFVGGCRWKMRVWCYNDRWATVVDPCWENKWGTRYLCFVPWRMVQSNSNPTWRVIVWHCMPQQNLCWQVLLVSPLY